MKKHYKHLPKSIMSKPKKKTAAQERREWEYTVIGGGLVRNSAFPRTAARINRGRGAMVRVIGVPLASERQYEYLDQLSEYGIMGQTAEEVAAWFIMEGVIKAFEDGLLQKLDRNRKTVRRILGNERRRSDAFAPR